MFDRWRQYSYTAQKHQRTRLHKFIFGILLLYITYNCFITFLFSVWVLGNDTMQPGLSYGDRLLFSSFNLPRLNIGDERNYTFKRGSIVLVDKSNLSGQRMPLRIMDGFIRFFTAQRISIFSREDQFYIKRVIALPGDEIHMTNFVFRIKPADSSFSLTEFELSQRPYHPAIPQVQALWDDSIPFSGNMEPVILGPDEIFVVSDDRSNTNDSRTWGPVHSSKIKARAVLRFWPVIKISLL